MHRFTMQLHVMVVLVLKSALRMFFFWSTHLSGWQYVWAPLLLICICVFVAQWRGWRFGNMLPFQGGPRPDATEREMREDGEAQSGGYEQVRASERVDPRPS